MPPKKKKGKKKGKNDGELTVDDKYKKTMEEVQALKDHLAVRKEMTRRAQTASGDYKSKMIDAHLRISEFTDTQRAVSSEMTRQYKTMQTELSLRVHQLETELQRTRLQLEESDRELKKTRKEKEDMCKEKDLEIATLKNNIKHMGDQFLEIFLRNLDKLKDQVEENSQGKWKERATMIQSNTKHTLLEFGLNPLEI